LRVFIKIKISNIKGQIYVYLDLGLIMT